MNATATCRREPSRVQTRHKAARSMRMTAPMIARLAGVALVFAATVVVALGITSSAERPHPVTWSAISVEHTGTLWEIASEYRVEGLSIAETVDVIRQENGLKSSTLYVGQTLVVPGADTDSLSVAQR